MAFNLSGKLATYYFSLYSRDVIMIVTIKEEGIQGNKRSSSWNEPTLSSIPGS